ncbi:MAG: glycosyltransferase [Bernardetiaceae bacterium]|jgi:UDP-N-acetylglucosamine:LPS N-acetylglucosamine transferase|nr:glycosyltransferase [Bernardetiaceae bacterium]
MSKVLFIMFPATGHLHATFALARSFRLKSAQPVYVSHDADSLAIAQKQGFATQLIKTPPFGLGQEQYLREVGKKYDFWDEMLLRASNQVFKRRKFELDQLMVTIKPKIVLIDTHCPTDFVILYPYWITGKVKIVFLSTVIPDQVGSEFPPMYMPVYPVRENKIAIAEAWRDYRTKSRVGAIKDWLKFFGRSDATIRSRNFRLSSISEKFRLDHSRTNGLIYSNVPEWVLAPAGIQFPGQTHLPTQTFLGLGVDEARRELGAKQLNETIASIRKTGLLTKIIYASFGTRYQASDLVIDLLKQMSSIIAQHPDWHLFLVLEEKHWPHISKLPNIHLASSFPQMALLAVSDVFITHAGLNSVKEAIHFGVPMLCYPLEYFGDQMGNAARVQFHGLGIMALLGHDRLEKMEQNLQVLLDDITYQERLKMFKKNNADCLREVIVDVLNSTYPSLS